MSPRVRSEPTAEQGRARRLAVPPSPTFSPARCSRAADGPSGLAVERSARSRRRVYRGRGIRGSREGRGSPTPLVLPSTLVRSSAVPAAFRDERYREQLVDLRGGKNSRPENESFCPQVRQTIFYNRSFALWIMNGIHYESVHRTIAIGIKIRYIQTNLMRMGRGRKKIINPRKFAKI